MTALIRIARMLVNMNDLMINGKMVPEYFQAYQEGKKLCEMVDNDMTFCHNPYPSRSKLSKCWNKGWNSYWNQEWTVKALVKSPYDPSFVFWCRHNGKSPVYLDPRYNKKGNDYLKR